MINVVMAEDLWMDLEEDTEALLHEWHVGIGDIVVVGQVMATAELVKTTHEVPAPASGRVAAIEVQSDETFGRGVVLARIEG